MQEINLEEFKNLDEDSQIDYVTDLEYEDEVTLKWFFLNNILKDGTISDLTRIEVLNVLGASDIPKKERGHLIDTILLYIDKREEDITYLSHCIMSLQNNDLYSSKVYTEMLKIFLDPKEDEDLRSNASVVIDNNTPKGELIKFYREFINKNDPLFAVNSEKWISEIEQRDN